LVCCQNSVVRVVFAQTNSPFSLLLGFSQGCCLLLFWRRGELCLLSVPGLHPNCKCVCVCVCMYVRMRVCYLFWYLCVSSLCVYVCVRTGECMYVCVCVCQGPVAEGGELQFTRYCLSYLRPSNADCIFR